MEMYGKLEFEKSKIKPIKKGSIRELLNLLEEDSDNRTQPDFGGYAQSYENELKKFNRYLIHHIYVSRYESSGQSSTWYHTHIYIDNHGFYYHHQYIHFMPGSYPQPSPFTNTQILCSNNEITPPLPNEFIDLIKSMNPSYQDNNFIFDQLNNIRKLANKHANKIKELSTPLVANTEENITHK